MRPSPFPALQLTEVCVNRGGGPVVSGLDCSVDQGTWFGIVGANGSGKTTLLRAIAGRLPIAQGTCEIFGEDLTENRTGRAERIGFAPPIEYLPHRLTAAKLLELAGQSITDQQHRNVGIWQALGLADLLPVAIGAMSSGMRQRVALALAFAHPARVVILDEPLNWLDPVAAFDFKAALRACVDQGLTLITALHDTATLCSYCDRGALIGDGQIKLHLSPEDLSRGRNEPGAFERSMIAALR